MTLEDYINAERGRGGILASALHVPPELLSQWKTGARRVPADRCPAIERATAGAVACETLRPDVAWQRIPDSDWPHAAGRPCIDVAAPSEAA